MHRRIAESHFIGPVKYSLLDRDSLIKMNPDSIKEYKIHNEANPQVSVKIDDTKVFLTRLEYGDICLFESNKNSTPIVSINSDLDLKSKAVTTTINSPISSNNGVLPNKNLSPSSDIQWYATKTNTDSVYLIKTNHLINFDTSRKDRKNAFTNLIADNVLLATKFATDNKYDKEAIKQAIEDYNDASAPINDYIITQKGAIIKCKFKVVKKDNKTNFGTMAPTITYTYKTSISGEYKSVNYRYSK